MYLFTFNQCFILRASPTVTNNLIVPVMAYALNDMYVYIYMMLTQYITLNHVIIIISLVLTAFCTQ